MSSRLKSQNSLTMLSEDTANVPILPLSKLSLGKIRKFYTTKLTRGSSQGPNT